MSFKKYYINKNIEEAAQTLEYLEDQGVLEGILSSLAKVGGRVADTAISGIGRGAIEGGKRALAVAMGKGKDAGPLISNAISNLSAAGKADEGLARALVPLIQKLKQAQLLADEPPEERRQRQLARKKSSSIRTTSTASDVGASTKADVTLKPGKRYKLKISGTKNI